MVWRQHITNTQRHTIMSSAGIETPHRLLSFERFKNNSNVTSSPDQTPSLLQPPSVTIRTGHTLRLATTFHPFLLSSWCAPSRIRQRQFCPFVLRAGGCCMMGDVGKAERQRQACPRGRGSGITWFHSMSSVSVPARVNMNTQTVRHINSDGPTALQSNVSEIVSH